ncbi:hypothetical protein DERF_006219 [Dermatophagoides farinae]|uniref:PNT domain-containing protein n=1 Tax=Dermatophagoides farinae TaxID=6954 RepID=A0A922L7Y3_DERFA|nr:hypothetical protein DERF_006219 [Dermatophagoides farinae]
MRIHNQCLVEDLIGHNNNNNNQNEDDNNNIVNCIPCILGDYNISNQIEQQQQHSPTTTSSSSYINGQSWSIKSPEQWQPIEVAEWIRYWASRNNIQDIEIAHLLYNQMAGIELCQMQREYFTTVCPQYGDLIYDSLQSLMEQFRHVNLNAQQQQQQQLNSIDSTNFLVTNLNSDYAPQQQQNHQHHHHETNDISNHHHHNHLLPIHLDLYHMTMNNTHLDSTTIATTNTNNDDLFDDNNNQQQQSNHHHHIHHHQFNHQQQLNHHNNNPFNDPSPNSYGKYLSEFEFECNRIVHYS